MQQINYNDPIELIEVFRFEDPNDTKKRPEYDDEMLQELYEQQEGKQERELKEFSKKHWITWEDIASISEYPFPDDWKKFPGEKFFLDLKNGKYLLVLGNATGFALAWGEFRNKYKQWP